MIHAIRANQQSFQEVRLKTGFNVILADITADSSDKDSRNGLGKSTLLEIIHFCLGADAAKCRFTKAPQLQDWEFSVEFDLGPRRVEVTRAVAKQRSRYFYVAGDVDGLGELKDGRLRVGPKAWREILGQHLFALLAREELGKFSPTFRALFGYVVRRGKHAFSEPFLHYKAQVMWDQQVNSAFLLGLAWENAQELQTIREEEKALSTLKSAAEDGFLEGVLGDVAQLEADRVRLAEEIEASAARLASFRVHEDYRALEQEASDLTRAIHAENNANVIDRNRLAQLRDAVNQESQHDAIGELSRLYEAAGAELPGMVVRRLEQVESFHAQVVENRREFLNDQKNDLAERISARNEEVRRLSLQKAELMKLLAETGALEDYTALQQRHLGLERRLSEIQTAVANLRKFENGRSAATLARERLLQRARRDFDERSPAREEAIRLFNAHSQALYDSPGRLLIGIAEKGFTFDVDIERAGSDGIASMQVFCYDLTIAQLLSGRAASPGFWIHDSLVFDGVDPRQRGRALARAATISESSDFQYLCTINSDAVPHDELPDGFVLDDHVRLRLTDATPAGSLLGIRF